MQLYGCRSWQNWWAKSCKLREDTEFAAVRAPLTLGTELLPLATGQSFLAGVMFITQSCSEFLVLCSELKKKKKKRMLPWLFLLALVVCGLGTTSLASGKCGLHRATHWRLLPDVFTLLVFYCRAWRREFTLILPRTSFCALLLIKSQEVVNPLSTDMENLRWIILQISIWLTLTIHTLLPVSFDITACTLMFALVSLA